MIAITRCAGRGEKTKFEQIEFLKAVQGNLLALAEKEPERFVIINAQQELTKVEKDVELAISDFLNK